MAMTPLRVLGGIAAGAGLMYMLDPEGGRRRLGLAREQLARAQNKAGDALDEVKSQLSASEPTDEMVASGEPRTTGFGQTSWGPTARVLASIGGALLGARGARRGGLRGTVTSLLGVGMLARAATNQGLTALARKSAGAARSGSDVLPKTQSGAQVEQSVVSIGESAF